MNSNSDRRSKKNRIYSGISGIPTGKTILNYIQPGALVLEGGAWREVYTQGALDALLEAGIHFQTVIGVSAGAMAGIGYLNGEIGWSARINFTYSHDPDYVGFGAMKRDHGVTGFSYIFSETAEKYPINRERFYDPRRRFVVIATDVDTGDATYFERGDTPKIMTYVQASATVPYVSRPVKIDGRRYLDGGCSGEFIPYQWAEENGYEKIMVIRTRDRSYRDSPKESAVLQLFNRARYMKYPNLSKKLLQAHAFYNAECDGLESREKDGKIFMLAPGNPITLRRFERDPEKLGDLYWRGYYEMKEQVPGLRQYLSR